MTAMFSPRVILALLITFAPFAWFGRVAAQSAPAPLQRPALQVMRDEEDWTFLRDPSRRTDTFDDVKYVALGAGANDYATFGAEAREFYEHYFNQFGIAKNGSNGYVLQRYLLDADLHLGRARMFTELESAVDPGRKGGPGPNNQNEFDPVALYGQWSVGGPAGAFRPPVALQAGRFELDYGNGSLLSANDGPGIRQSFDGVRAILRTGSWRMDLFGAYYVASRGGAFDDATNHAQSLFGVYAQRRHGAAGIVDAYVLGDNRARATFQKGTGLERRYTAGVRLGQTWGRIDSELDGAYQFGTFGSGAISAGFVAGDVGYTFPGRRLMTRAFVQAGFGSGDHDPSGTELGTFAPPTFRGQYFGALGQNGPSNSFPIEPGFTTSYDRHITAGAEYLIFERPSRTDGLYGIPGNLLLAGTPVQGTAFGSGPLFSLVDRLDAHTSVSAFYQRYFTGSFYAGSPNDNDIAYYRFVLDCKL